MSNFEAFKRLELNFTTFLNITDDSDVRAASPSPAEKLQMKINRLAREVVEEEMPGVNQRSQQFKDQLAIKIKALQRKIVSTLQYFWFLIEQLETLKL